MADLLALGFLSGNSLKVLLTKQSGWSLGIPDPNSQKLTAKASSPLKMVSLLSQNGNDLLPLPTIPKTNSLPLKNGGFQYESPNFQGGPYFQGQKTCWGSFTATSPMVGEVWTYQQVWSAASRAASHLLEMAKIRPATHVGMMLAGGGLLFWIQVVRIQLKLFFGH